MTLDDCYKLAILPAYALLPARLASDRATVELLAIGLQESKLIYRKQLGNGPARSLWQFERGGGVRGVLRRQATAGLAREVCAARGVEPAEMPVWLRMETDDVLGAAFSRLLLWSDPAPLPAVDDFAGGWAMYLRNWRPGKPHPKSWRGYHDQAREYVQGLTS